MSHPSQQYAPPPPPGWQPPQAQSKKKPAYKKVWFWLLAFVIIVIGFSLMSGGDGDAPRSEPSTGGAIESPSIEVPPAEAPAEDDPLTDDDWTISEVQLDDSSGFGTSITARVTNNADSTRTAILTLTIFKDGQMVMSTDGAVNDVEAGSTATVTFIGTTDADLPADGNYTYELQSNF